MFLQTCLRANKGGKKRIANGTPKYISKRRVPHGHPICCISFLQMNNSFLFIFPKFTTSDDLPNSWMNTNADHLLSPSIVWKRQQLQTRRFHAIQRWNRHCYHPFTRYCPRSSCAKITRLPFHAHSVRTHFFQIDQNPPEWGTTHWMPKLEILTAALWIWWNDWSPNRCRMYPDYI